MNSPHGSTYVGNLLNHFLSHFFLPAQQLRVRRLMDWTTATPRRSGYVSDLLNVAFHLILFLLLVQLQHASPVVNVEPYGSRTRPTALGMRAILSTLYFVPFIG